MDQICIPLPLPDEDEALEIEVTVGGTTHLVQYRIETLRWRSDRAPAERSERLRAFLQDYDSDWTLVQIGAPDEDAVPITFRQRHTTEARGEATE